MTFIKIDKYLLSITMILLLGACKSKKKNPNIITHKIFKTQHTASINKVGDYAQQRTVKWLGEEYHLNMELKSDPSQPTVEYDNQKYYDNSATVVVKRADGSVFYDHKFHKSDFERYVDLPQIHSWVLLGVVLDKVEDDVMYFAASIGAPDKLSDEYIPFVIKLMPSGQITIAKDQILDTANPDTMEEDNV